MTTDAPRNDIQIERDRRSIGRLYLQGMTQGEIAEELGISQSTVSRDLKAIQKTWIHDAARDIGERKAQELAKIDTLELTYWEAWKRSQENAEVETTKMQGSNAKGAAPDRVEKQKRVEGQVGDPGFLQGVQWCIERRCLIIGIDAPKKNEVTGAGGGPMEQTITHIYIPSNGRE